MKTRNARMQIAKNGSDVGLKDVTPAEAFVLTAMHHAMAGKAPLTFKGEEKEVTRTPAAERQRLVMKYGEKVVMKLFPGAVPNLPEDFDSAVNSAVGVEIPSSRLIDVDISN